MIPPLLPNAHNAVNNVPIVLAIVTMARLNARWSNIRKYPVTTKNEGKKFIRESKIIERFGPN